MRRPNKISVVLILAFCVAAISGVAREEDSIVVLNYPQVLSQRLSEITSLSGEFQQINESESRSANAVYEGQLWIDRPYLFRVDTLLPSKQTLVSDGQDFWSYDEDLEQVIISKLNKDLSEVPILLFSSDIGSIESDYTITGYSDEGQEFFILEPNSDISLFSSLVLEFNGATPASIKINAVTGEQTIIRLVNIVLNENISAGRFKFSAPEAVDIIDER